MSTSARAAVTTDAPVVAVSTHQPACACGAPAGRSGKCPSCAAGAQLGVQPKLGINPPGDRWEQEADRIAEQVVADRPAALTGPLAVTPLVQRQPDAAEALQSFHVGGAYAPSVPDLDGALAAEAARGRPLDPATRADLEPRFGRTLANVRVHDGATAAGLTRSIGARAFTHGNHIFFGAGQFDPDSKRGRSLLAHELTHTMQQARGPAPAIQRDPPEVNPEIARLPATRYVDAYRDVTYDLDYRAEGGALSTWLTVNYADGAQIDINIYAIEDRDVDMIQAMANGRLGPQGRIFPSDLTRTTVPRLWAARLEAIRIMEEFNFQFMMAAMPAVVFIITLAGAPPLVGGAPGTAVRRTTRPRTPRGTGAPAPAPAPRTPSPAPAPAARSGGAAAAAGGMSFRLLSPRVLRYGGRDIVVVQTSRGAQAFYRRTGQGGLSAGGAQPGQWAPFDGILGGWFDKARYVAGSADDALYRFGTQENRAASEWLGQQAIRAGDEVGEVFSIVNQFLDELGALRLGGG